MLHYPEIIRLCLSKTDENIARAQEKLNFELRDEQHAHRPIARIKRAITALKGAELLREEDRIDAVNAVFFSLQEKEVETLDSLSNSGESKALKLADNLAENDNNPYCVVFAPLVLSTPYFYSNKLPVKQLLEIESVEGVYIANRCRLLAIPKSTDDRENKITLDEALADLNSKTGESFESLNSTFNADEAIYSRQNKKWRFYWIVNQKEKNTISGKFRTKRLGFPF